MHRHVTNASMQVQTQLPMRSLKADIKATVFAAILQECQVKLIVVSAKHLPRHFDITIGRNIDRRRWRLLF